MIDWAIGTKELLAVSVMLCGLIGSWYLTAYRLGRVEEEIKKISELIKVVAKVDTKLDAHGERLTLLERSFQYRRER